MQTTLPQNYEVTLSEYWRILRKRKWTIIIIFFLVMFSTAIFTKFQVPVYQSTIEIKIEKQQPVFSVEGSDTITFPSQNTANLATELRLITSLPVMQKVVERMEVLPAEQEKREAAVHSLSFEYQGKVTVGQIENTNIIQIHATSDNPKKAALMATAIADVYIVENIEGRKKQSRAVIKYIENQLADYRRQLTDEETKLQKFNQNEKVFEVTPDIKTTLDRMSIEGTFEFEAKMLEIDASLKSLGTILDESPKRQTFERLTRELMIDNFIFVGLKRRLLELEFERFLLLIDYTEKHPSVTAKDQIISDVKNKIVEMIKLNTTKTMTLDDEADLALVVKKMFLETRREVLYRIVNKFYGDSGSLSTNQMQYVRLTRNIDRLISAYDTLLVQQQTVKLELAKVIDDVISVVSPARVPSTPIKPNAAVNYAVSSVVGLLLGIMLCFIKESIDSSVSSIADVEHELQLAILGIIPHMRREEVLTGNEDFSDEKNKKTILQRARLVTITNPKSWPAESLKMLRTNLIHIFKERKIKSILFTSSDKQEGKSTLVTNIALSMAQLGKKTLLIGANMRRPTVYKIFGVNREPGLSDILMGNIAWQDAMKTSIDILTGGVEIDQLLQMPGIDNLHIITCGRPVDNVSELLNSKALEQLMKEVKNYFDVVIIDCSPVMAVPDAITLSDRVDGIVLVYKVGHTPKDVLKMAKNNLLHANANILGVVLNDIRTDAQVGYSAYYYRYYSEAGEKQDFAALRKSKNAAAQAAPPADKNIFDI